MGQNAVELGVAGLPQGGTKGVLKYLPQIFARLEDIVFKRVTGQHRDNPHNRVFLAFVPVVIVSVDNIDGLFAVFMAHGINFPSRCDDSRFAAVTARAVDDLNRLLRISELCV
ncbi:hypothetical protein SDC9_82763 [bioreactor metagenome]|uniref:Uncharacterized protein n=1 Tax=bioreactor metagenome TaxID=1076179 RepID=A0A644Z7B3_9ZZZZ